MSDEQLPFERVPGVRLAAVAAGIRYPNRTDLCLLELAPGSECAAVFTRNAFCAAPVILARRHLAAASRYWLINSGNANAGTGPRGLADAEACCAALATLAACRAEEVLPFSTGVIGEPLPVDRLAAALPAALAALARVTGRIVQLPAQDAAEIEQHLAALRQAGIAPEDVEIRRADLEDVFLQVMNAAAEGQAA